MSTITERVAAGAAFLDEHDPGWWQHIDLGALDLEDPGSCVLGQRCPLEVLSIFRERYPDDDPGDDECGGECDRYWAYAEQLSGLDMVNLEDWAYDLGFTELSPQGPFGALTAEWKRVITRRRTAS